MKTTKFLKAVLVLGVVAACACGLMACSGTGGAASGGVAANVNGVDIMEDDVTQQIHTMRTQNGFETDDNWGLYLAMYQKTPSDMRTTTIESLRDRELRKEGAPQLGIELDTATVDMQLESIKASFSSDEKWQEALTKAGWTADEYYAYLQDEVLTTQINKHFEETTEVDEATLLETAATYKSYYDGLKRSSHILFKVEDTSDAAAMAEARAKAQEVLNKINSGELSFEDAAAQYSDDSSKDKGGDVGWSNQGFVSEYLTAVDGLELNQVSGLVESQFGIHIIKVTDVYTAPEEITSLDQLPEDFREGIRTAAAATKAQNDYNDWLTGLRDAATFTQNDMPSGLPYDVDMEKYQKRYEEMVSAYQSETGAAEGTEEGTDTEGAEGTGEAAASEESASPDSASSDSAN